MDGNDGAADASDPGSFDPTDVEPIGALIAVAFTGAALALFGFVLSAFLGDVGLALAGLGLLVVAASPLAYLRFRNLR